MVECGHGATHTVPVSSLRLVRSQNHGFSPFMRALLIAPPHSGGLLTEVSFNPVTSSYLGISNPPEGGLCDGYWVSTMRPDAELKALQNAMPSGQGSRRTAHIIPHPHRLVNRKAPPQPEPWGQWGCFRSAPDSGSGSRSRRHCYQTTRATLRNESVGLPPFTDPVAVSTINRRYMVAALATKVSPRSLIVSAV